MKHPRTIAAAALLLAACNDNPTAPAVKTAAAPTKAAFSTSASSAQLDFSNLSSDMSTRLLPSFDDQQVAKSIETSMFELNTHAMAGEIAEAQAASDAVRSSLKDGVASVQLIDVMNRTLDVVDRDLAAAAASGTTSSGTTALAP